MVRFFLRMINTMLQVQCNVKKIFFFKICLNAIIKTTVFENFDDSFSLFLYCWPFRLLKRINPSPRHNPELVFGDRFSRFDWIWRTTNSHTSASSKLPLGTSKFLSVNFFSKFHYGRTVRIFYSAWSLSSLVLCRFSKWIAFVKLFPFMGRPEVALYRCSYKKVIWKYAANLLENIPAKMWFP